MRFFSPCPRGLETVLAQELAALQAEDVEPMAGGARFTGTLATCYRVNLWSRVASRVLREVGKVEYRNEQDIYHAARGLGWSDWFDAAKTIRVDVTASRSPLNSIDFAVLRIKDAVCDHFRAAGGVRPSVNTKIPDVRVASFLDERHAMFYLDTSGEALFKRGYRRARREAPLKENLAAGLIALTQWNPRTEAFFDPMCGSGTLVVEAALIAANRAPGLARHFGFEHLRDFDPAIWRRLLEAAETDAQPDLPCIIQGSDTDPRAVEEVRQTLSDRRLSGVASARVADVRDAVPPAVQGVWLTNPPYGVRVGVADDLAAQYSRVGTVLKQRFAGWRCYFFAADKGLPRLVGLRESKRTPLFNGPIECRLFEFKMVSGPMPRAAR